MDSFVTLLKDFMRYGGTNFIVIIDDNVRSWFSVSQIFGFLKLTNKSRTIKKLSKRNVKQYRDLKMFTNRNHNLNDDTLFISEEGFYELTIKSTSRKVKKFHDWITGEVLPAIRKKGMYVVSGRHHASLNKINAKIVKLSEQILKLEKENKKLLANQKLEKYPDGGYIYIINHGDSEKNMFKIGKTDNKLNKRINTHNTSVPNNVNVSHYVPVKVPVAIEYCLKGLLYKYRYRNNKEYYECSLDTIVKAIEACIIFIDDFSEKKNSKNDALHRSKKLRVVSSNERKIGSSSSTRTKGIYQIQTVSSVDEVFSSDISTIDTSHNPIVELLWFRGGPLQHIITIVDENNKPWFYGKQVANMLQYVNLNRALSELSPSYRQTFEKLRHFTNIQHNIQDHTIFVNISGLTTLVLESQHPLATSLREWMIKDVIPKLLIDGSYLSNETDLNAIKDMNKFFAEKLREESQIIDRESHLMRSLKFGFIYIIRPFDLMSTKYDKYETDDELFSENDVYRINVRVPKGIELCIYYQLRKFHNGRKTIPHHVCTLNDIIKAFKECHKITTNSFEKPLISMDIYQILKDRIILVDPSDNNTMVSFDETTKYFIAFQEDNIIPHSIELS